MTDNSIDLRQALTANAGTVGSPLTSRLAAAGVDTDIADPITALRERIHTELLDQIAGNTDEADLGDAAALEQRVRAALPDMLAKSGEPLTDHQREELIELIVDDAVGLGPIEPLLARDDVTEIMVNRYDTIYIADASGVHLTDVTFASEEHLRRVIDRIVGQVGRRVDEQSPRVDARLEDGSRINATIPPIAIDGSNLTIRKHAKKKLTTQQLIDYGTVTEQAVTFLDACVKARLNILVCGSTDSGKTTMLNVLSGSIQNDHRIVTLEDVAELVLQQDHVIRLETRPKSMEGTGEVTMGDLVVNSLRMRPTRIVVGEVRDGAALDMLEAMSTGHEGSLGTVHCNSARDAIDRLVRMVLQTGVRMEVPIIREQIAASVDLIVYMKRLRDHSRKVMTITEVTGMEGDRVTMQNIFERNSQGDLVAAGVVPTKTLQRMDDEGIAVHRALFASDQYTYRLLTEGSPAGAR